MRLNRHFSKEDIQMAKRYANLLVSHVPVCIGCRWSRHWKGKVCTESKRTAIFSDLTIQSYWEQAQVSFAFVLFAYCIAQGTPLSSLVT